MPLKTEVMRSFKEGWMVPPDVGGCSDLQRDWDESDVKEQLDDAPEMEL